MARTGPPGPEMREPGTTPDTGPQQVSNDTTTNVDDNGPGRQNPGTALVWVPCTRPDAPQDLKSQLQRRREAARRLPPLEHSGRRDPWSRRTG
jgi:hypothetical protein